MNTDAALVAQLEREIDTLTAKYEALYTSTRTIQTSVQQFVAADPSQVQEILIGGTIPAGSCYIYNNGLFTCEIQPTDTVATFRSLAIRFKLWAFTTSQCGDVTASSTSIAEDIAPITIPFSMEWRRTPDDGLWIPIAYQGQRQYQRYYYDYTNNTWVAAEIEPNYTLTGNQVLLCPSSYAFALY